MPKFGKMQAIFKFENDIVFFRPLETYSFFENAHAYKVNEISHSKDDYIVPYKTLLNSFPCPIVKNMTTCFLLCLDL